MNNYLIAPPSTRNISNTKISFISNKTKSSTRPSINHSTGQSINQPLINMNCTQNIKEKLGNMSALQLKPHTTIAVLDAALLVVGCSAFTTLIRKVLADCTKYAPRCLPLIKPVVIGLFICILYDAYNGGREIIADWKSEKDRMARVKKLEFLVRKTEIAKGEKPKRKNHRGGVKVKKAKGKGKGTGTATIEDI